jgi:hypothetical protein
MKTSIIIIIIIISFFVIGSILLLSSCSTTKTIQEPVYETKKIPVYDDEYSVKYNRTGDLFKGRSGPSSRPISLAILEFSYTTNNNKFIDYSLMNKFYNELIDWSGFYDKFQPFKWTTIKDFYNISNLDVNNKATQIALYNQKIYFCCGAYVYRDGIRFKIYRTSDGKLVFNEILRNSNTSTYIKDGVRAVMYNNKPEYYYEIVDYRDEQYIASYREKRITEDNKEANAILGTLYVALIAALLIWAYSV